MATKLYVGNLSYQATEESLQAHFAQVGEVVSVRLVKDPYTGQARGFGFVEMASEEAAQQAISQLNGQNFLNRNLTVAEARPQAPRERSGRMGGRGRREGGPGRGGWRR